MQRKAEQRQDHEEQQQRERGGRGADAQTLIEPCGLHQLPEQPQESQTHRKGRHDAFQHMVALEVAELMRQHRLDLVAAQAFQQRVEEHDAFGLAEAGEVGVAVRAALRAVHHEQAAGGETAFAE